MSGLKTLDDLNDIHIDVLTEIGNIGSGSAASALAGMLSTVVDISVPSVKALSFNETVEFLGGAEKIVVGLLLKFHGDVSGLIMYLIQEEFAEKIVNTFYEKNLSDLNDMDDMDKSAVTEMGNIMAGSYVNALSGLTNLAIDISVPSLAIDMAGAILNVPIVEYADLGDKVLFINDNFKIADGLYKCNMILIPTMDSLSTMFGRLGIEL